MAQFVKVSTLDEVPADTMQGVEVGSHNIVLVNTGGHIYALSNICTHALCYLSYGWVEGTTIICSCHGAEFDLTDGRPLSFLASQPLTTYEVQIEGNDIRVGIP